MDKDPSTLCSIYRLVFSFFLFLLASVLYSSKHFHYYSRNSATVTLRTEFTGCRSEVATTGRRGYNSTQSSLNKKTTFKPQTDDSFNNKWASFCTYCWLQSLKKLCPENYNRFVVLISEVWKRQKSRFNFCKMFQNKLRHSSSGVCSWMATHKAFNMQLSVFNNIHKFSTTYVYTVDWRSLQGTANTCWNCIESSFDMRTVDSLSNTG